jgi:hypothetical protein
VAVGLPAAVRFRPVLASWVTSGKNRLTTLSGTTTLRGSVKSDALLVLFGEDEEPP